MERHYDTAVIGAGVFGAWTAWHLLRAGQRVVLIDQYGAASARASSGGDSRVIRMAYGPDEIYTRMAQRSLAQWKAFFAGTGQPELFRATGVLWLCVADSVSATQSLEVLARNDITHEVLDAGELARRYPQLRGPADGWAIFEPDSGGLMARRAVQAVVEDCVRHGAELRIDAIATPPRDARCDAVATQSGDTIRADRFVFACGPWLGRVLPEVLGGRLFPTRQEVFYFGTPRGESAFRAPALPIWLDFERDYYGFPDLDGRGIKLAHDTHGEPADPDTMDRAPTPARIQHARRAAGRQRGLPVREHVQRRPRDRPSSRLRQCLDRRWRVGPRLQARPGGRGACGRAHAGWRGARSAFRARVEGTRAATRGALSRFAGSATKA
jgi:sarcosine oxidase